MASRSLTCRLLLFTLFLGPLVLPLTACGRPDEIQPNDEAIVQAVRQALASDPMVGHIPIDVESVDGVVTLRSDRTNRDERARAVQLASQVDGVTKVWDWMK